LRNGLELPTPTLPIRTGTHLERRQRTDARYALRATFAGVGVVSSGRLHVGGPALAFFPLLRLLPVARPIVFAVAAGSTNEVSVMPQHPVEAIGELGIAVFMYSRG
jgi:hypothetical protein